MRRVLLASALAAILVASTIRLEPSDSIAQTVVGTISLGSGGGGYPARIAVNPATNRIYVTAAFGANPASANGLLVVDGASNATVARVPFESATSITGLAVNPVTNRIYVARNLGPDAQLLVIDGASHARIATLGLGANSPVSAAGPVAVDPTTNRIYVADARDRSILAFDGESHRLVAPIRVEGGFSRIAVDTERNRIYGIDNYNLHVVDAVSGVILAKIVVGLAAPVVQLADLAVNPTTNRIYVTNSSAGTLSVVDGEVNLLAGSIPQPNGASAVAVNTVTNRIYVVGGTSVSILDGASNAAIGTIPVGRGMPGLAANSETNRIYGTDSNNSTLVVLDGTSNSVRTTLALGRRPVDLAVSPGNRRVYVTNLLSNRLSVIDATQDTLLGEIPGSSGGLSLLQPLDVAVDPRTNRIYVTPRFTGTITVLDGESNAVIGSIAVVTGIDPWCLGFGLAIDPMANRIYAGNVCGGSISVIDTTTEVVLGHAAIGGTPARVAANPSTNRVYATVPSTDSVAVIDGASNTAAALIPVGPGSAPRGVAVNPTTNRIYTANAGGGTVSVIDGGSHAIVANIAVGREPSDVTVNPATNRVYVANSASNTVSVIDGASNRVLTSLAAGEQPVALEVDPVTGRVYVANQTGDSISVIADPVPVGATPSTTPAVGATPTAASGPARTGGHNFGVRLANSGTILSWEPGTTQTGYAVARLSDNSPTVLPEGATLPPWATSFIDRAAFSGTSCYILMVMGGAPNPTIIGNSAGLCAIGSTTVGRRPSNFGLWLDDANIGHLSWQPPFGGIQDSYLLVPLGASPMPLGPTVTSATHDTRGGPSCYLLFAMKDAAPIGSSQVLCALPSIARLPAS